MRSAWGGRGNRVFPFTCPLKRNTSPLKLPTCLIRSLLTTSDQLIWLLGLAITGASNCREIEIHTYSSVLPRKTLSYRGWTDGGCDHIKLFSSHIKVKQPTEDHCADETWGKHWTVTKMRTSPQDTVRSEDLYFSLYCTRHAHTMYTVLTRY